jgi:hypothetical protein
LPVEKVRTPWLRQRKLMAQATTPETLAVKVEEREARLAQNSRNSGKQPTSDKLTFVSSVT